MGVPMEEGPFIAAVQSLLDQVQEALLAQARAFRDENIVDVKSYEELKEAVAAGGWGGATRVWGYACRCFDSGMHCSSCSKHAACHVGVGHQRCV
jgi:hypothetical protein